MTHGELGCMVRPGTTLCLFNNPDEYFSCGKSFLTLYIGTDPKFPPCPIFSTRFEDIEVKSICPGKTAYGDICLCVLMDCKPEKPEEPETPFKNE